MFDTQRFEPTGGGGVWLQNYIASVDTHVSYGCVWESTHMAVRGSMLCGKIASDAYGDPQTGPTATKGSKRRAANFRNDGRDGEPDADLLADVMGQPAADGQTSLTRL